MLPRRLITEYWDEVQEFLRKEHRLSAEEAWRGVVEYRVRLDMHRVGDMIYHEDTAHVARTIAGALRQGGFREPSKDGPQEKKPPRRKKA